MRRVDDVEVGAVAELDEGRVWPGVAGVGDCESLRRETHPSGGDVMGKRNAFKRERADLIRPGREREPAEHRVNVLGSLRIFERDDLPKHRLWGVQRNGRRIGKTKPAGAKQSVQIDHVIRVLVRDYDRIQPIGDRGAEQTKESRESSVAQVKHQPVALVLDHEAAAGSPRFRPPAAATQNRDPCAHQTKCAWAATRRFRPGRGYSALGCDQSPNRH